MRPSFERWQLMADSSQESILLVLSKGPRSARQIAWALKADRHDIAVKLAKMVAKGSVEQRGQRRLKSGAVEPVFRLRDDSARS
jgi:predicted transcriptional regulator